MINDDQFGPRVMVSAGGIFVELFDDRRFTPVPCSAEKAIFQIQSLAIYKNLKGIRENPPCRVD